MLTPEEEAAAKAAAEKQAAQAATAQPVSRQGGLVTMKPDAFARRLNAEREKGTRAAMTEIEALAKKSGFKSLENAFSALARLGRNKGGGTGGGGGNGQNGQRDQAPQRGRQPESQPQTAPPQRGNRRELVLSKRLQHERNERIKADRARHQKEADLDALEAQVQLERVAWRAGIKDTDYAVRLLARAQD